VRSKISSAGMGYAIAGALGADGIKPLITPNDFKPATIGDLKKLVSEINVRYLFVKNIPPRSHDTLPYFDFNINTLNYMNLYKCKAYYSIIEIEIFYF